ncbi:hypothetical protein AB8A20_07920 [Tardiphaga sp. 604_B6_N1_1]|uniref:hypothetical protein n=1 Tax=unclassified Tardiphaga TaxID=2631404 RepID=UPI003F245BF6
MPDSKPKPKMTSKAKRKRGRPRDERVQHVIEITDWTWDLSFGVSHAKFSTGPYDDFRHLNITGKIVRPSALATAVVELTAFPDTRLNESERSSISQPKAVGWITHRGKQYSANLHIPADALGSVLQMLIAGRYQYVLMDASKSFRGEADIRHFRFSKTVTEDDLRE